MLSDLGVTSIGSLVNVREGIEDERTGSFRVLPGASVVPEATEFLDGKSARLLISRGGPGGFNGRQRPHAAGGGREARPGRRNFLIDQGSAVMEVRRGEAKSWQGGGEQTGNRQKKSSEREENL